MWNIIELIISFTVGENYFGIMGVNHCTFVWKYVEMRRFIVEKHKQRFYFIYPWNNNTYFIVMKVILIYVRAKILFSLLFRKVNDTKISFSFKFKNKDQALFLHQDNIPCTRPINIYQISILVLREKISYRIRNCIVGFSHISINVHRSYHIIYDTPFLI